MPKEVQSYQPGAKYAIVKAGFDLEANKKNYQLLLQDLASVTITRDNVNDDLAKDGREVLKMLTDLKDEQSKEPLQWHKDIMAVYKSLSDPIKEQIDRIAEEKKVIATQIKAEEAKQFAERTRIANAKIAIVDFTNKVANLIKAAQTDADIVAIEKTIGSEKTKTTVYQEFISELISQCDELRPQIRDQKENIRQLQKIQEKEKLAIETGNAHEAIELREQREHIQAVIQETGIRINEKAYEQAIKIDIVAPDIVDTAPKGRSNWKWRVDDIKLLQKKMPHLVKIVPNDEAINTLLATKKNDGSLANKLSESWNGITFFNDISYKK